MMIKDWLANLTLQDVLLPALVLGFVMYFRYFMLPLITGNLLNRKK
jgi:hypothetical protein